MHLPTATPSIDQSNGSPGFLEFSTDLDYHLTLKMASAQVLETSVTNNSPGSPITQMILFQSRYVTPGLKPFS